MVSRYPRPQKAPGAGAAPGLMIRCPELGGAGQRLDGCKSQVGKGASSLYGDIPRPMPNEYRQLFLSSRVKVGWASTSGSDFFYFDRGFPSPVNRSAVAEVWTEAEMALFYI